MSDSQPSETKPLTTKERAFLAEYFRNGMKISAAYHKVYPDAEKSTCMANGHRLLKKIKGRTKDWEKILHLADLDDFTLATEIRKKLRAKKAEFYQGSKVATVEDNGTQMRAVELLADVLGRRKMAVPVGPDGELTTGVLLVPTLVKSEAEWEAAAGGSSPTSKP